MKLSKEEKANKILQNGYKDCSGLFKYWRFRKDIPGYISKFDIELSFCDEIQLKYKRDPKSKLYLDADMGYLMTFVQIDWSDANPIRNAEIKTIDAMISELEKILSELKRLRLNYKKEVR